MLNSVGIANSILERECVRLSINRLVAEQGRFGQSWTSRASSPTLWPQITPAIAIIIGLCLPHATFLKKKFLVIPKVLTSAPKRSERKYKQRKRTVGRKKGSGYKG